VRNVVKFVGTDFAWCSHSCRHGAPRIVDRDIGAAKAGFQYSFILGAERLEFGRQQTHHLPLRKSPRPCH